MRCNPLIVAVVGAAGLLGMSASASAGTVHHVNFEIEIVDGLFEGNTYFGTLSYDDENLVADGDLGPVDGDDFPAGLLSLDFEVEGYTVSMEDDQDYPNFPLVYFNEFDVYGLDFIADVDVPTYGSVEVSIVGDEFYVRAESMQAFSALMFDQGQNNDYCEPDYLMYGIVTFGSGPSVVPTPAAAGTGIALLGLATLRRRRLA